MRAFYDHCPSATEHYSHGKILVNYNVNAVEKQVGDDTITEWTCDQVIVDEPCNYSSVVSAIIRTKYTADQVEAIILNGTDTQEHEQQYNDLQYWRMYAKHIAKEIIETDC